MMKKNTKICSKCKKEKELEEFGLYSRNKTGKRAECNKCRRKYRESNKERICQKNKEYYEKNKDKIKKRTKRYRENNIEYYKEYTKRYRKENRDRRNKFEKNKRDTDILYSLSISLRNRLYVAIKSNQKTGSAVKDLGCSIEEFKEHLESKFQPGMTWDNWSLSGWHIDHIKPLVSFDLTDREQFLEACHYTNLQPLWAKDNLSKGAKIIEEQ